MTPHPLPIARALAAALPRGTRAAGPNIPPNMRDRLREAEARAWSHSTLAGYLWESGERASRAIALASANNCCKQTENHYLASTGREAPGNPNQNEKMKTTTRTTDVCITFSYDPKFPHVLSIEGPTGFKGDDIYFSEHDGTKIVDLAPAFLEQLPKGAKIESNNRTEAWISHWDNEALAALDGRTFNIRFSQTFEIDDDGDENWLEDSSILI